MLNNVQRSLADLLGEPYLDRVCAANAALTGEDESALRAIARERVDFCPPAFVARQEALMARIGKPVAPRLDDTLDGAPSDAYRAAQHNAQSPLAGYGCFRVGEDGRLYFAGKSEHYHIPLGHAFPGYRLIEHAKRLNIPNATHNNTRGYITRLTERRLVAAANGIDAPDEAAVGAMLEGCEPGVLNRVINLETGSLAVEAALKMMLARFYSFDGATPAYEGRVPVLLVMADNAGGVTAGYHGTTVLAQMLRGLWPAFAKGCETAGLYRIEGVPINDEAGFVEAIRRWNEPPYKTAGLLPRDHPHELRRHSA